MKGLLQRASHLNKSVVLSHVAVFAIVLSVLILGYQPTSQREQVNSVATGVGEQVPTVDEVAAVSVAATIAQSADYLVANNIQERANSVEVKTSLAQSSDADFISKPQLVDQGTRKGISKYTTKEGDSVPSVASEFGISQDTLRWANGLSSDDLSPGRELIIPAVNGVVYTVKDGDTAESLADRFKADKDRIISYNDAELGGLTAGEVIVIPGGIAEETSSSTITTSSTSSGTVSSSFAFGTSPVFGGNGYAYGYCTWHVANRRAAIGQPVPNNWGNAATWAQGARAMGMSVDHTPAVGAIMQTSGGWGGYGHVAFVEEVTADGGWVVSEMNYAGWNVVSSRTFSASEAGNYNFIH